MNKDELRELVYYVGLITQIGLTIVFTILIAILLGVFLDKRFRTTPLFTVIFIPIGIAGGIISAYKQIMAKQRLGK